MIPLEFVHPVINLKKTQFTTAQKPAAGMVLRQEYLVKMLL